MYNLQPPALHIYHCRWCEHYTQKVVSKIGQNVQAFIARENELRDRQDAVASTKAKEIYSEWEKTGKRTGWSEHASPYVMKTCFNDAAACHACTWLVSPNDLAVRNQASKARQRLNEGRFEEMRELELEVSRT